jgi:hypothetical protein
VAVIFFLFLLTALMTGIIRRFSSELTKKYTYVGDCEDILGMYNSPEAISTRASDDYFHFYDDSSERNVNRISATMNCFC